MESYITSVLVCSFFLQAEDCIRDWSVTGVQTCALPISAATPGGAAWRRARWRGPRAGAADPTRSEERRVGKECRTGRSARHIKKGTAGIRWIYINQRLDTYRKVKQTNVVNALLMYHVQ